MNTSILSTVRTELKQQADVGTQSIAQSFFKEKVTFYGVKTATVSKIARKHLPEIRHLTKQNVFMLCEDLLKSDYIEEAFIAFDWSYELRSGYKPEDFLIFEHWMDKYVNDWAKCDTLCNHTIGSFIEQYPQYVENLKRWAVSSNRWLRRGAAVTLILPARRGKFLNDIFEIADILLMDKDDLVQKGYGWMLKEASKGHLEEVLGYVMRNRKTMPRTALRYAIEKMPPDLRKRAMSKDW
jgi:3-methyladenine DNA glycosylase AlkD